MIFFKDYSSIFNKNIIAFSTIKNNQISSEIVLSKSLKEYNIHKIASCNQVHSNNVLFVDCEGLYDNSDGLITTIKSNVFLKIQTADCVPIYIYDFNKGLIGLVHSGWKGTYKEIIKNSINIFFQKGSSYNDIKVFLGPSIRECCYEIKDDVACFFDDKYLILKHQKIYLNLQSKIIDDLLSMNIKVDNIKKTEDCTYHSNEFYSYRKEDNIGKIYSILGFMYE